MANLTNHHCLGIVNRLTVTSLRSSNSWCSSLTQLMKLKKSSCFCMSSVLLRRVSRSSRSVTDVLGLLLLRPPENLLFLTSWARSGSFLLTQAASCWYSSAWMVRKVGMRINFLTCVQQYRLQKNSQRRSLVFWDSVTKRKWWRTSSAVACLMLLRESLESSLTQELQMARSLRYIRKRLTISLCSRQYRPILLKVYCDCRMQLQRFRMANPSLTISMYFPSSCIRPQFTWRSAQRQVSMLRMNFLRYWQQKAMMFWLMNSRCSVYPPFPSSFSQKMYRSTSSPITPMNSASQVFLMMACARASALIRCTSLLDLIFLRTKVVNSLRFCWAVVGAVGVGWLLMLMLMWLLRVLLILILMLTLFFSARAGERYLQAISRIRLGHIIQ